MHCFLSNGVVDCELELFIAQCAEEGVRLVPMLSQLVKNMKWPKHVSAPSTKCFTDSGSWTRGASELLSLYPVVRDFVVRVLPPDIAVPHRRSLLALFHVLDGYSVLQRGKKPKHWMVAMGKWLGLFKAAYPSFELRPKHHFCTHMEHQINQHELLLSCFCLERRHKTFKGFASATTILNGFEKGVLLSMMNDHLRVMSDPKSLARGLYLDSPRAATQEFCDAMGASSILFSLEAYCRGVRSSAGDMVYVSRGNGYYVAEVLLHMNISGVFKVLARPYRLVATTSTWQAMNEHIFVGIEYALSSACWENCSNGRRVLLLPHLAYEANCHE